MQQVSSSIAGEGLPPGCLLKAQLLWAALPAAEHIVIGYTTQ